MHPIGNLINGFQSNITDVFGDEGGKLGKLALRGDATKLPEMYPPPNATRRIPLRIDFFANSKKVNVGHFNNLSMPAHDGSATPLLVQYEANKTQTHGMKPMAGMTSNTMAMINFNSDEVHTVLTPPNKLYKEIAEAYVFYSEVLTSLLLLIILLYTQLPSQHHLTSYFVFSCPYPFSLSIFRSLSL
jgi:hypothetical protein